MDDPAPNSKTYRRGLLPIWLHVTIVILWSIAAFLGAILASLLIVHRYGITSELQRLTVMGAFLLACLIPQWVMFKLIPARCAKCGGRCWAPMPRGNATLKYICENCDKVIDTGMRGGNS